jgi:uncharacterized protein (TIGR02246 family)
MTVQTQPTQIPADTSADTAARMFVAGLEAAWNAADGAAFGARFTDDAVFVDVRGSRHRGRPAIAAGHQGIFDSIYRGSTVGYEVESIDQLGPDVAVAHANATLDCPTGPMAGRNHARFTVVLVRGSDAWEATTFHNTLVVS